MEVVLVRELFVKVPADALVNPAVSSLEMNEGLSAVIRKAAGKDVEDEAVESAPLELGQAIATSAGKLDAKFVIHAVVGKKGVLATEESVRLAMRNALELADSLECESVAFPLLGDGQGLSIEQSVSIVLTMLKDFSSSAIKTVFVVVDSPEAETMTSNASTRLHFPLVQWSVFKSQRDAEERAREKAWESESEGSAA